MDESIDQLIIVLGVVAGLAVAYGKVMGGYQTELSQTFIDAFQIRSRFRRLANLTVGVGLAVGFTVVGALWLETWAIVPAGVLAGILSSVEAGKVHDREAAETPATSPTVARFTGQGARRRA